MKKRARLLKTILIIAASLILLSGAALFFYRYQILQYSAEKIIRRSLPDYITVERMSFNFRDAKIAFSGFKILNPPNFSGKYLMEIGEMACQYRLKGRSILDGIEILNPLFKKPVLSIERLADGRTNLQEMMGYLQKKGQGLKAAEKPSEVRSSADKKAAGSGGEGSAAGKAAGDSKPLGIIKLPEDFTVKDGKVVFLDGMVSPGRYVITLDNIDANLHMVLNNDYTKVLNISTAGVGVINGRPGETIKWDTKLDPTTSALTMSNRFNVSGVDITAFSPYYDKYSPFIFRSGYFSGMLIFDFDNGSIGSTNEVLLSRLSFSVKQGYENAQYLETTVPDLMKYFTSSRGDVVFDFKIKGQMSNPQFYLGPISKQAIAVMAVDKIAQALASAAQAQANPQSAAAGAAGKSSDIDKASEYINMFRSLLKDKK